MARKPDSVRAARHEASSGDRHLPTAVEQNSGLWARELSTLRIADLFLTARGLPGHWTQIQMQIRAGNNFFFRTENYGNGFNDGGKTTSEGRELFAYIADSIVRAAMNADFDFGEQRMEFPPDCAFLKMSRINGVVKVSSTPGELK
ncbi:hypothetical protein J2D73_04315 [Acetobacter sacchari]|uniref:Uncharacterized protein n=1 Tax=Acetobacter sacchari TaxID=2661687 RepID=A0ABS3LSY4_9PROT|nr:hypothetical protein [Acetobacter sacchari]MBO1359024.1 hypothetical protein [Acetobacter sacchari]